MKKVYIGIGHGGSDPGACANGLREADLNLAMGITLQAELQRCGVDTKISRTSDVDFNTAAKIVDANSYGAHLVLDLHFNAGGGVGFEVYHSQNADGSPELARAISSQMDAIDRKSRGVKTKLSGGVDYFGIIRQTKAPAVLIEYAFLDNATDVALIKDPAQRLSWAQATAKGLCDILGIDYVPQGSSALLRVQVGAFKTREYAEAHLAQVVEMGLEAFLVTPGKDGFYRVQVGAFRSRANAENYLEQVKGQGLEAFVVEAV